MHSNQLAQLLPRLRPLIQHGGRAPLEPITPLLLLPLIRRDQIPHQRRLLRRNDTNIHITPGPQIVKYPRQNRVARQLHRLLAAQVFFPLRFKDAHRGQGAGAESHVGEFVGAAVRVHGEEAHARRVHAGDDEVGADVALVAEEVLLQHRHACHDARLATCGEGVQFEVGGDERGGEFRVGGGAGAGAPDLRGDVVKFLAVLVVERRWLVGVLWKERRLFGVVWKEEYLVGDYGS